MTVQPNPAASQLQRFANDITARLAQLAKDPPELLAYLRAHADCIVSALRPVGFCYEMQNGMDYQRVLLGNMESLDYRAFPEQENAFRRAIRMAATKRQPVLIPPNTLPSMGQQGLAVEDAAAPEELPIFNQTAYEQMFVPILLAQSAVGVLHIWFQTIDQGTTQGRVALLKQICGEVELYLKARRINDISQEVTRLTTYSRLLEELSGDLDLDSVSWNIVNFARETVACDRVCLFVARKYERNPAAQSEELDHEFELFACSGLKRPNPRSEQAVILQKVAQKLTQLSLAAPSIQSTSHSESAGSTSNGKNSPANLSPVGTSTSSAKMAAVSKPGEKPSPQVIGPKKVRPVTQITLMMRDPSKVATRPEEVNDYFEIMPMNWATVLPLFDRDNRVCGIVLFEGTKASDKLMSTISQMRDLAVSAGRAIGTALHWSRQPSLRMAQGWVNARQAYVNTPAKRKWLRYGLPLVSTIAILAFPVSYRLKGDATVLPVKQTSLPALVSARLLDVRVREGETVKAGQLLARFDTRDLELQLRQSEQEIERSLVESDTAMSLGHEAQMQLSRLNAAKARTIAEKIKNDINKSTLVAPFDGVVLGAQALSTRIGEVVRLGEPVLQVVDPSDWQVRISMREQDLIYLGDHLNETGPIPASLTLIADPSRSYDLELASPTQIAYGLDTSQGKYDFITVLPLATSVDDVNLLKSGFAGRATFKAGRKPVAYILFKDFINFLRVRFF